MRAEGFTLVELLIVILVISILAAMLIPAATEALCAAKEAKAATMIRNLDKACRLYERDYSCYPPSASSMPFHPTPLVAALNTPGPRKMRYMEITVADFESAGSVGRDSLSEQHPDSAALGRPFRLERKRL